MEIDDARTWRFSYFVFDFEEEEHELVNSHVEEGVGEGKKRAREGRDLEREKGGVGLRRP